MAERDWMADAACLGSDPDMWFPPKGENPHAAKRLCERCSVRERCLDYAMATDQHHGVWGGLTERERMALRVRSVAAVRRTA